MWAQAVKKAGTTKVTRSRCRDERTTPCRTHRLHPEDGRDQPPPVEAGDDRRGAGGRQFSVVWKTSSLSAPSPGARHPGNESVPSAERRSARFPARGDGGRRWRGRRARATPDRPRCRSWTGWSIPSRATNASRPWWSGRPARLPVLRALGGERSPTGPAAILADREKAVAGLARLDALPRPCSAPGRPRRAGAGSTINRTQLPASTPADAAVGGASAQHRPAPPVRPHAASDLPGPEPVLRRKAAEAVFGSGDGALERSRRVLARATDPRHQIDPAPGQAAVGGAAARGPPTKLSAIEAIASAASPMQLSLLAASRPRPCSPPSTTPPRRRGTVSATLSVLGAMARPLWYGISLGSVLLLAAIGLAITFGIMGVINMAHGEMVMLGAYTTFVVQEIIRDSAPHLFDCSLVSPCRSPSWSPARRRRYRARHHPLPLRPAARDAARHLGAVAGPAAGRAHASSARPTARSATPSWMSGAFQLGQLTITYSRLWIIVFALAGVRGADPAAAQDAARPADARRHPEPARWPRRWASARRGSTRSPSASAPASPGMAGVALSQIDNVCPNLGQGYIIDSFMVVVFGGVGNLWGTLVGAMSLGIVNKFLEPYAGAVLGKILVLVLIILFIQKRPRGLFALKGRAVEA